ncbi:hypothetical protein [Arsenicibacter rosenii]|uniref:hypothetical protein n=1 Tax=Arsenicibacter rosenii TaxID=1750698 RepID=UPI0015A61751|nr:hypothetical protein [Arsenicibacter rosenii]
MENIRKVQADKSYIPQAAEIANQVDKLFAMAKLEIQYMQLVKHANKADES